MSAISDDEFLLMAACLWEDGTNDTDADYQQATHGCGEPQRYTDGRAWCDECEEWASDPPAPADGGVGPRYGPDAEAGW